MSRSYKKNPYCTDGSPHTTKESKKFANKKVRNYEDIPNGSAYKKVSESWDIHDYVSNRTWEEAQADWEKNEYLRKLAASYFVNDQKFMKAFCSHSAAKSVHHGFVGGLLGHWTMWSNNVVDMFNMLMEAKKSDKISLYVFII